MPYGAMRRWLWRWPENAVWLLRLGRVRGGYQLVVVDCDSAAAVDLARKHLPPTPWQVATRRGMHFYYSAGPGLPARSRYRIAGIDVKAGVNSYVVAPHSEIDGVVYTPAINYGAGPPPPLTLDPLLELERLAPRRRRQKDAAPRPELPDSPPELPAGTARQLPVLDNDAPPPPPQAGQCEYGYYPCIGTRNILVWEVLNRRVMRNLNDGDDRVTPDKIKAYGYAVNKYNFGHDVKPGDEFHTLPYEVIDEMLPRVCAAVAEVWSPRGYRESQKRRSNLGHYAHWDNTKECYAALEAAYAAGATPKELQALSGQYREKPYSLSQIYRIIAKGFKYQQPRRVLPPDDDDNPPELPADCPPDGSPPPDDARQKDDSHCPSRRPPCPPQPAAPGNESAPELPLAELPVSPPDDARAVAGAELGGQNCPPDDARAVAGAELGGRTARRMMLGQPAGSSAPPVLPPQLP